MNRLDRNAKSGEKVLVRLRVFVLLNFLDFGTSPSKLIDRCGLAFYNGLR